MVPETIYYSTFRFHEDDFYIAASRKGLCYIGKVKTEKKPFQAWIKRFLKEAIFERNDQFLKPYIEQIEQFLRGKMNRFTFNVHFIGTSFQQTVWQALLAVPYGETRSYTDIARNINRPTAIRAVANAIGQNPLLFVVPCHRIIHKNGDISGFSSGIDLKKYLLNMERKRAMMNNEC